VRQVPVADVVVRARLALWTARRIARAGIAELRGVATAAAVGRARRLALRRHDAVGKCHAAHRARRAVRARRALQRSDVATRLRARRACHARIRTTVGHLLDAACLCGDWTARRATRELGGVATRTRAVGIDAAIGGHSVRARLAWAAARRRGRAAFATIDAVGIGRVAVRSAREEGEGAGAEGDQPRRDEDRAHHDFLSAPAADAERLRQTEVADAVVAARIRLRAATAVGGVGVAELLFASAAGRLALRGRARRRVLDAADLSGRAVRRSGALQRRDVRIAAATRVRHRTSGRRRRAAIGATRVRLRDAADVRGGVAGRRSAVDRRRGAAGARIGRIETAVAADRATRSRARPTGARRAGARTSRARRRAARRAGSRRRRAPVARVRDARVSVAAARPRGEPRRDRSANEKPSLDPHGPSSSPFP